MSRSLLSPVLRVIAAVVLFALFIGVSAFPAAAAPSPIVLLASVKPIAMVTESGTLANVCSSASINARRHLWLSAAHCFADPAPRYIMGERVTVVVLDVANDIAIVSTPIASAPALPLASRASALLDGVMVGGHPFGYVSPFLTVGTIAALDVFLDGISHPVDVFQMAGAPGNSGSAILNARGEIISVLQLGWGQSFSPMVAGVPLSVLAQYRAFWAV